MPTKVPNLIIDRTSVHVSRSDEFGFLVESSAPHPHDRIILEDSANSFEKKYLDLDHLYDPTAILWDVANQYQNAPQKITPEKNDRILIEDSWNDEFKKKYAITAGIDTIAYHLEGDGELGPVSFGDTTHDNFILIEDWTDPNPRKRKLRTAGLDHTAIHWDIADEYSKVLEPLTGDLNHRILIEDSLDDWKKKRMKTGSLLFQCVRMNYDNQFQYMPANSSWASEDRFIMETAASSWTKRRISGEDLFASSVQLDVSNQFGPLDSISPVDADRILIESSLHTWDKKHVTYADFTVDAIKINVADQYSGANYKEFPDGDDLFLIEDYSNDLNKKYITFQAIASTDSNALHYNINNEWITKGLTQVDSADTTRVLVQSALDSWDLAYVHCEGIDTIAYHVRGDGELSSTPWGDKNHSNSFLVEDNDTPGNEKRKLLTAGADKDAIHYNVANEYDEANYKAIVEPGDRLLIEDMFNSGNKKFALSDGIDGTAIHWIRDNEYQLVVNKANIEAGDIFLIEDSSSEWSKKYVYSAGIDAVGVHVSDDLNYSNEFSVLINKASPVKADKVIIEDSEASWSKKYVECFNIDTGAIHTGLSNEYFGTTRKASPVAADRLLIEDSDSSWDKKYIKLGDYESNDPNAVHLNEAAEFLTVPQKNKLAPGDIILIEDSNNTFNKKYTYSAGIDGLAIHGSDAPEFEDEFGQVLLKYPVADNDRILIEDSNDSWKKKYIECKNSDIGAIHKTIKDEFKDPDIPVKTTLHNNDKILIEDSDDLLKKKYTTMADIAAFLGITL